MRRARGKSGRFASKAETVPSGVPSSASRLSSSSMSDAQSSKGSNLPESVPSADQEAGAISEIGGLPAKQRTESPPTPAPLPPFLSWLAPAAAPATEEQQRSICGTAGGAPTAAVPKKRAAHTASWPNRHPTSLAVPPVNYQWAVQEAQANLLDYSVWAQSQFGNNAVNFFRVDNRWDGMPLGPW
jgi:hypothetical protein